MQVHTRHTPTFGVARLGLAPGESVRAGSGTMVATSYGVGVDVRPQGGLLSSLARAALGGESPLVFTYTAPVQGGWIDVAPPLPGDLHVIELNNAGGWCLSRECWLASDTGVELQSQWAGFRPLFGGERGFLVHASGIGRMVLSGYGAMDILQLAVGDYVTVDTGHVVGYPDGMQSRIRPVCQGVPQSMRTGEGLVFDFAGPGQVLTQARAPRGLVCWLQANGLGARG
ncbi:MAG: TIGR00266 family protein [Pseudonocardiaceae bacterium]